MRLPLTPHSPLTPADPGVAYAHLLAMHVFKIPNIVVGHAPSPRRPSVYESAAGVYDTSSSSSSAAWPRAGSTAGLPAYPAARPTYYGAQSYYGDGGAAGFTSPISSFRGAARYGGLGSGPYLSSSSSSSSAYADAYVGGVPVTPIGVPPSSSSSSQYHHTAYGGGGGGGHIYMAPPGPAHSATTAGGGGGTGTGISPPRGAYAPRPLAGGAGSSSADMATGNLSPPVKAVHVYTEPRSAAAPVSSPPAPAPAPAPPASPFQTHRLFLARVLSGTAKKSREYLLRRTMKQWRDAARESTRAAEERAHRGRLGLTRLTSAMDKIALRQRMRVTHGAFAKWAVHVLTARAWEERERATQQARAEHDRLTKQAREEHERLTRQARDEHERLTRQAREEAQRASEQAGEAARAAALRVQSEAEAKARAEAARARAEQEKTRAEQDRARAEQERGRVEEERARLEGERATLDARRVEAEKAARSAALKADRVTALSLVFVVIFLLALALVWVLAPALTPMGPDGALGGWEAVVRAHPWVRRVVDIERDGGCVVLGDTVVTPLCFGGGPAAGGGDASPPAAGEDAAAPSGASADTEAALPSSGAEALSAVGADGEVQWASASPPAKTSAGSGGDEDDDPLAGWECNSPFGACGMDNVAM